MLVCVSMALELGPTANKKGKEIVSLVKKLPKAALQHLRKRNQTIALRIMTLYKLISRISDYMQLPCKARHQFCAELYQLEQLSSFNLHCLVLHCQLSR